MFNKDESRIIIILGLLGALSCIVSVFFLSGIPTLDFKFPLGKERVFKIADEFLSQQHISSQPLVKKSHVSSDEGSIVYLQKTLGIDKTKNLLESLPLYYWQIDYTYQKNKNIILFSRNKTNSIRLVVSPTQERIIGFRRFIPPGEYDSAQILSKDKSERIANDFFSLINFDISNFRMTRYSPLEKRYTFEWEKDILEIEKAKLKVKVEIFGDKVGNFSYFLEIPPSELKKYLSNGIIDLILFISLNTGIFVFGIFTLVVSIIKRRKLKWKFGLVFALLISPTFNMDLFKFGGYRGIYTAIFLGIIIVTSIIYFFWTMVVSTVARSFANESHINLFPIKISSSVLLSYIFVFSGLGFSMLFFTFILKIFNPVTTLGFYSFFSNFPSSKFSYLIPPLLSLSAAVSEEIFFRALMISFLKRYLKKINLAIILSTLVWSFLHVSPFLDNDIYPAFIKGFMLLPVGFMFGYIFIRFGLVCAIATHYLYDLAVIGLAFSEYNNFSNINENILVLLMAAIFPLAVVSFKRIGNYRENDA